MKRKLNIKFLFILAMLVLSMGISVNAQSSKMKSLMREIKETYPKFEKLVAEKCDGAKVKYDVDFASFGDNYDALLRVPSQGLNQSASGIRRFCTNSDRTSETDPDKVQALKSKVQIVRLKQVANKATRQISLQKDGTLLIEMPFHDISGGYSLIDVARIMADIL